MFGNLGSSEILLVGLVLFLLFGGKKLPEMTRGLIDSIKQFRDEFNAGARDAEEKKKN